MIIEAKLELLLSILFETFQFFLRTSRNNDVLTAFQEWECGRRCLCKLWTKKRSRGEGITLPSTPLSPETQRRTPSLEKGPQRTRHIMRTALWALTILTTPRSIRESSSSTLWSPMRKLTLLIVAITCNKIFNIQIAPLCAEGEIVQFRKRKIAPNPGQAAASSDGFPL